MREPLNVLPLVRTGRPYRGSGRARVIPHIGYALFAVVTSATLSVPVALLLRSQLSTSASDFRPATMPPVLPRAESLKLRLASDALPFREGDSVTGCASRGILIAQCIESEEALRAKAAPLWAAASPPLREDCLSRTHGAMEPVGKLYACLVYPGPPANLD